MSTIPAHPGRRTSENSRANADALRRHSQFEAAVTEYSKLWPDGDQWTGWGYAHCLRKLGRRDEALRVARELYELAPNFDLGRSLYAWSLYDTIKAIDDLTPAVIQHARLIVKLARRTEAAYASVSPFAITVLRVARGFVISARYSRALQWLQILDPERLSTDEFILNRDGKERRLASHRERYYGIKTRALEKLGRWSECLDCVNEAMQKCLSLHHDNDLWFARRAARAKIHLGSSEEGIAELEQLAQRKAAFFIFGDIADAAWKLGDTERTIEYCLRALNSAGEIGFKLGTVQLLACVLRSADRMEDARNHLELCIAYRKHKEWKIPEELRILAKDCGFDAATVNPEPDNFLGPLRAQWRRWSEERNPRKRGIVQRLLPHGRAGFIVDSERQRFYFDTRDWVERRTRPIEGAHVSFATKQSFDRKHQRASIVACEIRVAESNGATGRNVIRRGNEPRSRKGAAKS